MRAVLLALALSIGLVGCDSINGPPTNNPPPGPPVDLGSGQPHTACPVGQSIC
jgi:hypothetical protein